MYLKRGLLILIVCIIFLETVLAQTGQDSCLVISPDLSEEQFNQLISDVATRIWNAFSQISEYSGDNDKILDATLISLEYWQPEPQYTILLDHRDAIRAELRRIAFNIPSIEITPSFELNEDEITLRNELIVLTEMEEIYRFFSGLWDRGYSIESGWRHDDYDPQNFKYIDEEINRREIFEVFPEEIQEEYRNFLLDKYLDVRGDDEDLTTFFRAIPSREVLGYILRGYSLEFFNHRDIIRPLLGHIFYIEDKHNYYYTLLDYLERENIELEEEYSFEEFPSTLVLPFSYVNLYTMNLGNTFIRTDISTQLERVSVDIDYGYRIFGNIGTDPNINSYSTMSKRFGIDYAIFYFPKINIEGDRIWIGLNYHPRENFKGYAYFEGSDTRITDEEKIEAFNNYKEAFENEEEYESIYRRIINNRLSEERTLIESSSQTNLDENEIPALINSLQGGSIFNAGPSLERNPYSSSFSEDLSSLLKYLESEHQNEITPIDFFKVALEITDYDVLDALMISHEFLFRNRYRLNEFPLQIFEENPEDNSGAWYHFFGTAVLAYSSQEIVTNFIGDEGGENSVRCIDLPIEYRDPDRENLLRLQRQLILLDGARNENDIQREISTLASIFGEEIELVTDLSGEVFVNFRGAAFGRELFRFVSGRNFEYVNSECEIDSEDIGYTLAGNGIVFDIDSRKSLVYIGFGGKINSEPTDDELRSIITSWALRNILFPFIKEDARRFLNI